MPKLETVKASLTKDKVASLKAAARKAEKPEDRTKYDKLPDAGVGPVDITYDFGATPAEAASYFGDKVVMRLLNFAISHPIQTKIRDGLAEGKTVTAIQAKIYDVANKKHIYKPGLSAVRMSAVEKEANRMKKLDPEQRKKERAALLAALDALED
jgi:hypothetical protein